MSRAQNRGGKAPIRTAAELSLLLPIPLLMLIEGYAQPVFPGSTPAHPSPYVAIVLAKPKATYPPSRVAGLPLYLNEAQWTNLVVPLLQSKTLQEWRGQHWTLGDLVSLLNNVVGPDGEVVLPAGTEVGTSAFTEEQIGRLYACDPSDRARLTGRLSQFLVLLTAIVYRDAVAAGY